MPRMHSATVRREPALASARSLVLGLVALVSALLALAGCDRTQLLAPQIGQANLGTAARAARPGSSGAGFEAGSPIHLEGEIGPGALWSIDAPADWNGDLVVYMHGYSDPALDVALPDIGAIRSGLLARGYAVAVSSYSENGYAVREGEVQSHQLSGIFASRVATPRRTYLFGQSMGGLIGLLLSEKHPAQYAGGLFVCGVVGGSDDEIQYLGDARVLFDAVYPGVLPGDLEHPPSITNLNAQVIGPVLNAIGKNPQGIGVIQLLARRPLPGANGQEVVTSLLSALVFGLQGGGDLLDRTHGHTYFDNQDWRYNSPALPPALVDDINARIARYDATPDAEAFLAHYGEPSGRLQIPVLSLHTSRDPVVPVFHEGLLGDVAAGPWLLQRQVVRYGHCTFSVDELMANFDTLVEWVQSGQKPAM